MNRPRLLFRVLFPILFITLTAQTPKPLPLEKTLRASRWQKRVLLVAAPAATQTDFQQQKALLAGAEAQLNDRDFLVLEVFYNQLSPADQQFLTQKTGIRPPAFAVVLIGKDGGVKEKSARHLTPVALFGTVNEMPMRREEMQRARKP